MYKYFWSGLMRTIFSKIFMMTGALMVGGIAQAASVTVDFDDTLPTYFGLSTYQEDGFTLTSNVPDGTLIDVNNVVRGNLGIFSGGTDSQSLFWGANGSTSTISFANDAGDAFSLLAFDASSLANLSGQLTLTGTLAAGGSVNQLLNLDSMLTTYSITGMDGLSALSISFDGGAYFAPFDLDNVELSIVSAPVPVPAAVWLFSSALAGMFGWSRRGRAAK
jgi:hypothetical protein